MKFKTDSLNVELSSHVVNMSNIPSLCSLLQAEHLDQSKAKQPIENKSSTKIKSIRPAKAEVIRKFEYVNDEEEESQSRCSKSDHSPRNPKLAKSSKKKFDL